MKAMKKQLFVITFFLYSFNCFAADFYISQTGGDVGGCIGTTAIGSLDWESVGGNDTIHLCGTIYSSFTIGKSGTDAAHPLTIKFETDAKFSKAYWGTGSSGAIYGPAGVAYIVIDGGTNGVIENTDNGTAGSYGNTQTTQAIDMEGAVHDIEIKNLTIRNIYVRTNTLDYSTAANDGTGIKLIGRSNISINNCAFSYIPFIAHIWFDGTASNYSFYNNTIAHSHTGPTFASTAAATLDNVRFYNNTINLGSEWNLGDTSNHWHAEALHTWTTSSAPGSLITNMYVYNNNIGPLSPIKSDNSSASTAWLSFTDAHTNIYIYNNVLLSENYCYGTDGIIELNPAGSAMTGVKIYNNTMIINGGGAVVMAEGYSGSTLKDTEFKNNIIKYGSYGSKAFFYQLPTLNSASQINYNVYTGATTDSFNGSSFATWQGSGHDLNSSNGSSPSLDASYIPTSGDNVAKDKGLDLWTNGAYFTTDKRGYTRPTGTLTWDIGAYEYGASSGGSAAGLTIPGGVTIR
jgi:hypothetical protein